jgi:DNA-binding IclR family transcriptional regulator
MARPAPAATRAVDIMSYLIAHPTQSFTLSELARHLRMNMASTHTVLAVLTAAGYVVRHPVRKTYALGPLLVAAGQAALERYPVIDVARDEIRKLSRQHGVELLVTAPAGDEIVALVRAGPRHPHGLEVGRRVPLVPPIGSVFVAWGTAEEIEEWLGRAGPRADQEAVARYRRSLRTVRERGYSVALQPLAAGALADAVVEIAERPTAAARRSLDEIIGELGHGNYHLDDLEAAGASNVGMIAAPVFDQEGRAVLALALSDFPRPLTPDEIVAWANRLRDTALVVTRQTHGRAPDVVLPS